MDYKKRVQQMFLDSGVVLKETELERIEYTDFGLGAIETEGLNLFVYENNERYCGKELVLLPYQTCPEHRHPPRDENEGKKETFRCRKGLVYLYVEGKETKKLSCIIPKGQERYYTAKKKSYFTLEISTRSNKILNTGSRQVQQARLSPNFLPAVMIQVIVLRIQLFIVNTKVWEQADEPK